MNNKLRDLFQQPFDLITYRSVILSQLLHAQRLLTSSEILEQYDNGDQLYGLGYLTDNEGKEIGLYYTHVRSGDVRRKRVGFRKMLHPYVKYGVDAAVAVFDDGEHWRLSYICDLKGGVTSAKRFSYVFGDPKGQYNTPVSRLTDLAQKRLTIDELHKTFSVDALSKEFFDEYHRHYDRILRTTVELISKDPTLYSGLSKLFADYIKKMMGRIVFLHFLQKKGWLNGDPEFLKNLFFMQPFDRRADFLEQVLEPLFFGIFNTEPQNREKLFRDEGWDVQLLEQWKGLPYLNGGLFERDSMDTAKLKLPASLFERLFEFMASYNFTVDENDPDDADIGVDPEMLGKIFESLLEDNKAKGAFYTPKEIVRYMCKESLIAYLDSKIETDNASEKQNAQSANNPIQESKQLSQCGGADTKDQCVPEVRDLKQSIRDFVEQHEFPEELEPYRTTLDTALREVKICDPAIGSGAFPMGLLNELWRCREALDVINHAALPSPLERGTAKPGGMLLETDKVGNKRAALKKEIIENNIYGVDIEKGAIDIARLRFWLSIVVDAERPEPLPNFDYKFMQGNSLIESFDGHDLSHIMDSSSPLERGAAKRRGMSKAGWAENQTGMEFGSDEVKQNLRNWLKMYFSLTDHKEKAYYRELINSSVKNYIVQQGIGPAAETRLNSIDPSANKDFFLWHTWFKDIFDNGGFDIVIGNPPYVVVPIGTYPHYEWNSDLYKMFFELSLKEICRQDGVVSLITPKFYLLNKEDSKIRLYFMNKVNLLSLNTCNPFDAVTENVITIIKCGNPRNNIIPYFDFNTSTKTFVRLNNINKEYCKTNKYNEIIYGLDENIILILQKMYKNGIPLGKLTESKRGAEVSKKYLRENINGCETLIGQDMQKYSISWNRTYLPTNHKEYQRLKKHFDSECIYLRRVDSMLEATVSLGKHYGFNKNVYGIKKRIGCKYEMLYLLACINSKALDFYYKKRGSSAKWIGGVV